jgi:hypothetical protein
MNATPDGSTKHLYEVINPSDQITFRATLVEAACIADRLLPALYFVKNVETGKSPEVNDLQSEYDAIWKSAEKLASYAAAYRSFMVGSVNERELVERAISTMQPNEAKSYLVAWNNKRRTSWSDLCGEVWATAEKIAAYQPETESGGEPEDG